MARKGHSIRLYDAGMFLRWISAADAQGMEERGEAFAKYEERPSGPHFVGYELVSHGCVAGSSPSHCSLTQADAVTYAAVKAGMARSLTMGLNPEKRAKIDQARRERGFGPLPEIDFVQQVIERVEAWPVVADDLAVTVVPRGA